MKLIKINEIENNENEILSAIRQGKIFLYPTDTVYGLGCNAMDKAAVQKIREIKKTEHQFSIIVPSKKWAQKNVHIRFEKFLKLLPGPYTLIFIKKNPKWLPWVSEEKIGIRIPKHPIAKLIEKSGLPFVTTSANISGQTPITNLKELPKQIIEQVDIAIDGGQLSGKPSIIFDLTNQSPKRIR